jgi:VanZ family protein
VEQPLKAVPSVSRKVRWLIWSIYLACWTVALVAPIPNQEPWVVTPINIDLKYLFAKSLHVAGYGLLAILSGWLHVQEKMRWRLMFLLLSHGTVTELIQQYVKGRSGHLHDVAYDQVGVALGLLLTWKWWSEPV